MADEGSSDDGRDADQPPAPLPYGGEDEVAVLMCIEGRRTVHNQNRQQSEMDTKASRLMRANLVLVGLILSGFSLAAKSDGIATAPFLNSFAITGVCLLVSSVVVAGVTYTATESRVGVSHTTVRHVVNADVDRAAAERGLAKAYARWIEVNRRSNVRNAFYATGAILLVLAAVVFLVAGAVAGAFSGRLSVGAHLALWTLTATVVAGIGWLSGIRDDYREWRAYTTDDPVTAVQTFNRDDAE